MDQNYNDGSSRAVENRYIRRIGSSMDGSGRNAVTGQGSTISLSMSDDRKGPQNFSTLPTVNISRTAEPTAAAPSNDEGEKHLDTVKLLFKPYQVGVILNSSAVL